MAAIFISYSSEDLDRYVDRLYTYLADSKLDIWVAYQNIQPGQAWPMEVHKALLDSSVLLYVHSKNAVESRRVWEEFTFALNHNKIVIPLLFERHIALPYFFESLQYIDFSRSFETGIQHLLDVLIPVHPTPPTVGTAPQREHLRDSLYSTEHSPSDHLLNSDRNNIIRNRMLLSNHDPRLGDERASISYPRSLADELLMVIYAQHDFRDSILELSKQEFAKDGAVKNRIYGQAEYVVTQTIEEFHTEAYGNQARKANKSEKRHSYLSSPFVEPRIYSQQHNYRLQ